jgi:hypothetical protein
MENFTNTLVELQRAQSVLTNIKNKAISLGAAERGLNLHNAWGFIESQLNRLRKFEDEANKLGTTIPNALKSYRMTKRTDELDTSILPDVLRKIPGHWLSGRRPLTPTQAKQKLRLLLPMMVSVWAKTSGDDELQRELVDAFQEVPPNQFELELFAYDEGITVVPFAPEEEPSVAELMRAREAASVGPEAYGVGGVLDVPAWS